MSNKQDIILDFISQFRALGAENCFSNGMCWYFTVILRDRFNLSANHIMYDPIANHFATDIDGRIYDITGDITDDSQYHWEEWVTYADKDRKHTKKIYQDCIHKVPNEIKLCRYCSESQYDYINGGLICIKNNNPKDMDDVCNKEE